MKLALDGVDRLTMLSGAAPCAFSPNSIRLMVGPEVVNAGGGT